MWNWLFSYTQWCHIFSQSPHRDPHHSRASVPQCPYVISIAWQGGVMENWQWWSKVNLSPDTQSKFTESRTDTQKVGHCLLGWRWELGEDAGCMEGYSGRSTWNTGDSGKKTWGLLLWALPLVLGINNDGAYVTLSHYNPWPCEANSPYWPLQVFGG